MVCYFFCAHIRAVVTLMFAKNLDKYGHRQQMILAVTQRTQHHKQCNGIVWHISRQIIAKHDWVFCVVTAGADVFRCICVMCHPKLCRFAQHVLVQGPSLAHTPFSFALLCFVAIMHM